MEHVAERCHRALEPLHAMVNFVPELQEMMTGIVYVAIDPKADRKDIVSRVYDRTKE